jgi:2-methylthioadenine synthetase
MITTSHNLNNDTLCKTVFFETFGCQMNKLDAELSLGLLQEDGYKIVDAVDEADVILFNTCKRTPACGRQGVFSFGSTEDIKEKTP